MTRDFCKWEVDPFFPAAEEVQDSADRLESAYRTWIYTKSLEAPPEDGSTLEFRRRELSTALGTAKWQLEDFEKAVSGLATEDQQCAEEDAHGRRKQFVEAIHSQISTIEKALFVSNDMRDLKALPALNLGQEEKDDFALFLSGSRALESDTKKDSSRDFPGDQKATREAPSTSPGSMETKNGKSLQYLGSASSSYTALQFFEFMKPDKYSVSPDNFLGRLSIREKMATQLLEVRVDHSDEGSADHTSEELHTDYRIHSDGDGSTNHKERESGHPRSISVGSGLNSWRSGSILHGFKICERGYEENNSSDVNLLPLFKKRQRMVELKRSKSGFKRWKRGDAFLNDHKGTSWYYKLIRGSNELGKGTLNIWLRGNFNGLKRHCSGGTLGCDKKQYKGWGEALQSSQRSPYAFPSSRPVRLASAVLMALGLVGLFSFHVSASTF